MSVSTTLAAREHAEQIARAALRAVDAGPLVSRWLDQHTVEPDLILAAGKAAAPMARAALAALDRPPKGGLVVVPEGYDDDVPPPLSRLVTSHPLPDERSIAAGREALARVRAAGAARWLGLWSGGASAALELPAEGTTLEVIREQTALSMRAGEPIAELYARRCALSAIKGGKLARAGGIWHNLVLSDVKGDEPALVGGGPAVLPGDGSAIIGSLSMALDAAKAEAFALRYATLVLDPEIAGEAASVGERLSAAIAASTPGPPLALLLAGEPSVSGVPSGAVGGRMQELALAAAIAIEGLPAVVYALSTDGRDGNSPAGGALVDGSTAVAMREAKIDARAHLARHESFAALSAVGATRQLSTQTNVRDLVIALVYPT